MSKIRMCRVTDGVHQRVMALAEERGVTFGAALEIILERGEAAHSELEARGYRLSSRQTITKSNLGGTVRILTR